uniref:SFRICE_038229 n=1 Tax=Spodoptera frugiperda TaxID=7108 RepID=A0A2H1WLT7_SPOFR
MWDSELSAQDMLWDTYMNGRVVEIVTNGRELSGLFCGSDKVLLGYFRTLSSPPPPPGTPHPAPPGTPGGVKL